MNKTAENTKKKVCYFCTQKINDIDYKDMELIRKFISPYTAKILARRKTGVCAKHQRKAAMAIKRARFLALLPFVKK